MSLDADTRQRASSSARSGAAGATPLFALVIILCLAVLAVLAVSTGHSSLVLSQRQAATMQETYRAEIAAQTFVAEANDLAARGQTPTASLAALLATSEAATQGITATAMASDDATRIFAEFTTPGGRVLKVTLTRDGADAWRIDAWRMTGVVNEEQPIGTLYLGD